MFRYLPFDTEAVVTISIPVILIVAWFLHANKNFSVLKSLAIPSFVIYTILAIFASFYPTIDISEIPPEFGVNANFVPFATIWEYYNIEGYLSNTNALLVTANFENEWWQNFHRMLFGGIIFTIPFGILVPIIFPKFRRFLPSFLLASLLLLLIEGIPHIISIIYHIQYKIFDIDDIILGLFGFVIGFIIFQILQKFFKKYL